MKLNAVTLALVVGLLIGSTACTSKPPVRPEIPKVTVCSSSAFINRDEYVMVDPPKEAKQFELWQAEYLLKYPGLLKSYDTLRECWEAYDKQGEAGLRRERSE